MLKSKNRILLIGFTIIIILITSLGIISINKVQSIAVLTVKLYDHPHTVSNAVLNVNARIISIHRNMKDVVLARDKSELEESIAKVHQDEVIAYQNFKVILERFLGDKTRIISTQKTFTKWKGIRSEVIELSRQRRFDEAAFITKNKGARHVELLTTEIEGLIDFAQNKADEFLKDSKNEKKQFDFFIYSLFFGIIILIIAIALFVLYRSSVVDLELKKSQEQLFQSSKMESIGKLTGGLAHDYNNMLGVIMGYAEILKKALAEQPELANYAVQIHKAGDRGAKLTKKLLSFTKESVSEAVKVDINSILLQQKDLLQKTMTVRIKLIYDLEQKLWSNFLNNCELEDVILNLTINANYAMKEIKTGAILTVQTRNQTLNKKDVVNLGLEPGDYVKLSFSDTGCGMDETVKQKVFDPFYTTKGTEGTGLGLSQVFGFVKRSGGAVKVNSIPNQGCQIIIYFPRHIRITQEDEPVIKKTDRGYNSYESILVVDDEKELLFLAAKQLKVKGYDLHTAESGKEAIEILKNTPIDLMISDVIMPEMDGYQLADYVTKNYPQVKIQMCSGFSDYSHISLVNETLYQNRLYKPVSSEKLYKSIRNLLDNPC